MMDELPEVLKQLAEQLGTTAEYLWPILIRQARIEAYERLMGIVLWGFVFYQLTKGWGWLISRTSQYIEKDDKNDVIDAVANDNLVYPSCILVTIIPIILIISGVFFIISLWEIPTMVYNPEYWALTRILQELR